MGNVFHKSGSGSSSSQNSCASSPIPVTTVVTTPSAPINTHCKSDEQEANVEFAREFVVHVVENISSERKQLTSDEKGENDTVEKPDEECSSVASLERSESSFFSLPGTDHNTSLPDLLQPEAVYKKHADTDTDTAEYESAAETDLDSPLNAVRNGIETFLSELVEFETLEENKNLPEGVKTEYQCGSGNPAVHDSENTETQSDTFVIKDSNVHEETIIDTVSIENSISSDTEKKNNFCLESTDNLNEVNLSNKNICTVDDQVVNTDDSSVVCELSTKSIDETVVGGTHTTAEEVKVSDPVPAVNKTEGEETLEIFDTNDKLARLQESRECVAKLQETHSKQPVSETLTFETKENVTLPELCTKGEQCIEYPVPELIGDPKEGATNITESIQYGEIEPLKVCTDSLLSAELIVESTESVTKSADCGKLFAAVVAESTQIDTDIPEFIESTQIDTNIPEFIESTQIDTNIPEFIENVALCLDSVITTETINSTETAHTVNSETQVCADLHAISSGKSDIVNSVEIVHGPEYKTETPEKSEHSGTGKLIPEVNRIFSVESDKKNDSLSDLVSNLENLHLYDSTIYSVKHIDQPVTNPEEIINSSALTTSEGIKTASVIVEDTNDSLSDLLRKVNNLNINDSVSDRLSEKNEILNSDSLLNADSIHADSSVEEQGLLKFTTQINSEKVLNSDVIQSRGSVLVSPELPHTTITEELTVARQSNSSISSEEPNYLYDTFINLPKSFVEKSVQETVPSEKVEAKIVNEVNLGSTNVNVSVEELESVHKNCPAVINAHIVDSFDNCEVKKPSVLDSTFSVSSPNVASLSVNFDSVERKNQGFGAEDVSPVPLTDSPKFGINKFDIKHNISTSTPVSKVEQKPGLDELYEICNRQQRLLEQEDTHSLKEDIVSPSLFNVTGNLPDLDNLDAENFEDKNISFEEIVEIEAKRLSEVFHAGSHEYDSSDDENNFVSINTAVAMESPKALNNLNSVVNQSPGHSPPNALKSSAMRCSSPVKRGSPPLSVSADSTNISPKLKTTPPSTKLPNDSRNLNEQLISRKLIRDESPSKETQLNRNASPRSLSPAVQKTNSRDSLRNSPVNVNLYEADTPAMKRDNETHSVDINNVVSQSSPPARVPTNSDSHMPQPSAELINRTIQELTDNNSSVRKEIYSSPAKNAALLIVEKLISSNKKTPVKVDQHSANASRMSFNDSNEEDENLKELLMVRELLNRQSREYEILLSERDDEVEALNNKLQEKDEKISHLTKRVSEKAEAHKQMSLILEEYEKTISRLVADKEQEQRAHEIQIEALRKEKDADKGHLEAIEIAFSDLHKKYERSKEVIEGLRKNEEVLRSSLSDYESIIRNEEQKYTTLKQHASAQLEKANVELDQMRRNQQAEISKLKAMLKKAEVNTSSLEEILKQKTKENQELTAICDELINKVGSSD